MADIAHLLMLIGASKAKTRLARLFAHFTAHAPLVNCLIFLHYLTPDGFCAPMIYSWVHDVW